MRRICRLHFLFFVTIFFIPFISNTNFLHFLLLWEWTWIHGPIPFLLIFLLEFCALWLGTKVIFPRKMIIKIALLNVWYFWGIFNRSVTLILYGWAICEAKKYKSLKKYIYLGPKMITIPNISLYMGVGSCETLIIPILLYGYWQFMCTFIV